MDTPESTDSDDVVIDFQSQISVFANINGGITIRARHPDQDESVIAFRAADADLIIRAIRVAKNEAKASA